MARAQLKLFQEKNIGEHGGDIRRGARKTRRAFTPKKALHVTLRAEEASGAMSFLQKRNANFIKGLLQTSTRKRAVRVYKFGIVSNHIHLCVRAKSRKEFQNFLKEFSSKIARFVTSARRGNPFGKRFFDRLAYSRIVSWGRELVRVCEYIEMNTLEALGVIPYRARKRPPRALGSPRLAL